MSLTKVTNSMIQGAVINVLDYGAIANATWNSGTGVVTGTDNTASFTAAIAAAVTKKVGVVYVPSGTYYLSAKITIPASVALRGDGSMKHGYFYSGEFIAGTILLINGTAAQDCIQFVENTTFSGLADMSIFNTNDNAIRSVVSVVGVLYPQLSRLTIGSLKAISGAGLYLSNSASGLGFQTLWGEFANLSVDGFIRYALHLDGTLLANNFTGGDYKGDWVGIRSTGVVNSHTFTGVKIESSFAAFTGRWAGLTPSYTNTGLFGGVSAPAYFYPIVELGGTSAGGNTFNGCYIENNPLVVTTYDDGVHGVLPLYAVFENGGATIKATHLLNMSWNGVYLFDSGTSTVVDGTGATPAVRHATQLIPFCSGTQTAAAQSISSGVWTNVNFTSFGSDSNLELNYDAGSKSIVIKSDGVYQITLTVAMTPWAASTVEYLTCRINGVRVASSVTTVQSPICMSTGLMMVSTISVITQLVLGDTPSFMVYQNSGGNLNIDQTQTFLVAVKLN